MVAQQDRTTPRHHHRRIAWVIGGVVVIVVVVVVVALAAWFIHDHTLGQSREDQHQTYQHPTAAVVLDLAGGDVALNTGADNQVTANRHLTWRTARPGVTEQWQGDTLHIRTSCPDGGDCSVDYELTVPPAAAVTVNDRGGAITTNSLRGTQRLRTAGGDVTLNGVGGTVDAHTDGGAVHGTALTVTQVNADSQGGEIALDCATAPDELSAQTQGGNVTALLPRTAAGLDGYQVHATAVGNQQTVDVPNEPEGRRQVIVGTAGGTLNLRYR